MPDGTLVSRLGTDDLHVWRFDADAPDGAVSGALGALASDELERAKRFTRDDDRRRYLGAHVALRHVLASYLLIPAQEVAFGYGERGKPFLRDSGGDGSIRFNMSHSDGIVMIAVARSRDVGVDVERLRDHSELEAMMAIAFTKAEREAVEGSGDPSLEFARTWVRKEAIAKASGMGIGALMPDSLDNDWTVTELLAPQSYVAAVAYRGEATITCFD